MAKELALGLVIGGAVSSSVKSAFKDVDNRIKRLDSIAGKAKVLQSFIGETKRLQEEWRKAHASGSAGADGLRRKLEANLSSLRRQGVEVRNLGKAYEEQGRKARSAQLKATGHAQLQQGGQMVRNAATGTAAAAATLVVPTKVSAEYGAIIRDIAIKAGIANKPEEAAMSKAIIGTSRDTGMARNEVAGVVNALVGAGMDLKQAVEYAPVASKFVVGQGADGTDTAKMINALGQNAKITDPKDMQKALEAIAYQGQAGSFEAADMAKWFPELLAKMASQGITGIDAVQQLGAMLQVQMKTAGSSDEAANNLKNWIEKIGSGETVKQYKDAGIDYEKSMRTGLLNGKSNLETSFDLAQKYVQTKDPKKAKEMDESLAKISKETDPKKAKEMMTSLEAALRTGDLFADMQVKAALTGYMQNKELYQKLKKDSGGASGILDKNLAERRETSSQKWAETGQAMDDAMRSIGDALRPATDQIAGFVKGLATGISKISEESPNLTAGLVGAGAAIAGVVSLLGTVTMAKGLVNLARGSVGGGKKKKRAAAGDDADDDTDDKKGGKKGRAGLVAAAVAASVAAYKGKAKPAKSAGADGKPDNPKPDDGKEAKPADGKAGAVKPGEDKDDKEGDGAGMPEPTGGGLADVAVSTFSALAEAMDAGGDDDAGGGDDDGIKKVFVTNASEMGGGGGSADTEPRRRRGRRGRSAAAGRRGGGLRSGDDRPRGPRPAPAPRPPVPRPPVPPPAPRVSRIGSIMQATRSVGTKVAGVGKVIPGAKILDAGLKALETYQKDGTRDEKAEGYGDAAGSLAGAIAGGSAGAAIGSVVPIIGTAIGGLIGAYLGGTGGGSLGGLLGKTLFGGPDKEEVAAAPGAPLVTPLVMKPPPGPAVPSLASMGASFGPPAGGVVTRHDMATPALDSVAKSLAEGGRSDATLAALVKPVPAPEKPTAAKVEQSISLAPQFSLVVQGDVKDPNELLNKLMPEIQRRLSELGQQVARRDMTDDPLS